MDLPSSCLSIGPGFVQYRSNQVGPLQQADSTFHIICLGFTVLDDKQGSVNVMEKTPVHLLHPVRAADQIK